MEKNKTKKEDILDAVLQHITEKGPNTATIREIARIANVNSAAISYYFGSKDNLLHEASKRYYIIASETFNVLYDSKLSAKDRLKKACIDYADYMIKYIGFLKIQLEQYINESDVRPEVEYWMGFNALLVSQIISEITGIKDRQILTCKVTGLMSSLIYPAQLGKYNAKKIGFINFFDKIERDEYINCLVDTITSVEKSINPNPTPTLATPYRKLWIE